MKALVAKFIAVDCTLSNHVSLSTSSSSSKVTLKSTDFVMDEGLLYPRESSVDSLSEAFVKYSVIPPRSARAVIVLGVYCTHEGSCEDLARQNTVTHLSQLQLGFRRCCIWVSVIVVVS